MFGEAMLRRERIIAGASRPSDGVVAAEGHILQPCEGFLGDFAKKSPKSDVSTEAILFTKAKTSETTIPNLLYPQQKRHYFDKKSLR